MLVYLCINKQVSNIHFWKSLFFVRRLLIGLVRKVDRTTHRVSVSEREKEKKKTQTKTTSLTLTKTRPSNTKLPMPKNGRRAFNFLEISNS